jgi:DNA invertase Pin-like site-specific DNA recombinase
MKENEGMYAYIRVSSTDQNVDRQMLAIQQLELPRSHIFIDKVSGKDFDRPQYQRMLKRLKPGNTLVVKSIDRLGRNYDEILEQWRLITKEIRADIVVLDMPLLDTRKGRDLIGTLISEILRADLIQTHERAYRLKNP